MQDLKKISKQKKSLETTSVQLLQAQAKNKKALCGLLNKKLLNSFLEQDKHRGTNNLEVRNRLIRKYVYLVNWVVNRLPVGSIQSVDKDDLIGYGTIGLIEAVDRFDPKKSSNFQSFAITRIRGSIYDHLRASDWLTRGSRKRVKNLLKVASSLEAKLGRYPSDRDLAKELSISLKELRIIQQEAQIGIFSLDEVSNHSEENTPLIDNVSSNSIPLLDELEENELKELLTKAIEALPEREKTVIGLYHYKKLTFKEIAEVMSFSESRASQIHARAISLLKAKMLRD